MSISRFTRIGTGVLTAAFILIALLYFRHVGYVCVQITDTGVGIPQSDIFRLFDKFYRVNDHKKMASGTGLGLNGVK